MAEALDARSEILARIRSALGRDGSSLAATEAWQAIPRNYKKTGKRSQAERIELFAEKLLDYGVNVTHCQPAQIASAIAERLRSRGKRAMLVSREIDPAWLPVSLGKEDCIFLPDNDLTYTDIDRCDGVLTGCAVGIAKTGTICICHGPAGGRRALTLIPDYHLCIVRASDVVETVPEAMRLLDSHKKQPITLISGPSATADIEMTRIQGVHGPRVLDVVIVT